MDVYIYIYVYLPLNIYQSFWAIIWTACFPGIWIFGISRDHYLRISTKPKHYVIMPAADFETVITLSNIYEHSRTGACLVRFLHISTRFLQISQEISDQTRFRVLQIVCTLVIQWWAVPPRCRCPASSRLRCCRCWALSAPRTWQQRQHVKIAFKISYKYKSIWRERSNTKKHQHQHQHRQHQCSKR